MSRHTENDGVTPDARIMSLKSFDMWIPRLGPPPRLIGAYHRKEIDWAAFESGYRTHINQPEIQGFLWSLALMAERIDLTLLCIEESPRYCHRRLLAETLITIHPKLKSSAIIE